MVASLPHKQEVVGSSPTPAPIWASRVVAIAVGRNPTSFGIRWCKSILAHQCASYHTIPSDTMVYIHYEFDVVRRFWHDGKIKMTDGWGAEFKHAFAVCGKETPLYIYVSIV